MAKFDESKINNVEGWITLYLNRNYKWFLYKHKDYLLDYRAIIALACEEAKAIGVKQAVLSASRHVYSDIKGYGYRRIQTNRKQKHWKWVRANNFYPSYKRNKEFVRFQEL